MSEEIRYRWALFGTFAALAIPLWLVTYVPMVDLPYHLARVDILARYGQVPVFQQLYERSFYPLPNMAIDALGWMLVGAGVPLLRMAQVLLTLSLLAFALGCHWLGESIQGRWTWAAVPATLLSYNSTFFYGYVNFNFSLGMYLLALAGWVRWQGRWTSWRMGLVTLGATACYVSHLGGFSFLCASMGVFSLWRAGAKWRTGGKWRILAELLTDFVPVIPGLLLYALQPFSGESGQSLLAWDPWGKKAMQLLSGLLGYSTAVDVLVIGLTVAALGTAYTGTRRRILQPWLWLAGLFLFLFLSFPSYFHSASDAHLRFLFPAMLLALFAVPVQLARNRRVLLTVLLAGILAIRVISVGIHWRMADQELISCAKLLEGVEEGSRIYPIFWHAEDRDTNKQERHLLSATSYASPQRNAVLPFIAIRGQQPIFERSRTKWRQITADTPPEAVDWASIAVNFDYIAAVRVTGPHLERIRRLADPVGAVGPMTLYRMRK